MTRQIAPASYVAERMTAGAAGNVLRKIASELDWRGAIRTRALLSAAGVNTDDFVWMVEQIGAEIDRG